MRLKRLTAVLIAAMMIVGLCACSSTEDKKDTVNKDAGTQITATEGAEAAPDTVTTPATETTPAEDTTPAEKDTPAEETTPAAEATPTAEATPAPAVEVIVKDMIGREVKVVPGSYKRVVCIGAGALRMYSYVGDTALLCGVEDIDNQTLSERPKMFDAAARPYVMVYSDVFSKLPSCGVGGPNAQAAEAEKILACEPDIVISEYEDVEKEDALQEQLGVPVITLRSGQAGVFDEAFAGSVTLLGMLFGNEEGAKKITDHIASEAEEIKRRTSDIAEESKPSVYICGLGNWGTTNHLMTAFTYYPFTVANIKNAVASADSKGIQPIEAEYFASIGSDIDIMIVDAAAVKNIKPLYAENPDLFIDCKAASEGEVYLEMPYNAYYTNYEIALVNTWFIAKTVYPELFEDVDITAKLNETTAVFLGKECADEIYAAPASFGGYGKIDMETFFK